MTSNTDTTHLYTIEFYRKYQYEFNSFIRLSSKHFSSLLSLIFSYDICNDTVMKVHLECEKIKHLLQEEYCRKKYNILNVIISGSSGEQWMPYGDSDIDQMFVENIEVGEVENNDEFYFEYSQYSCYVLVYRNNGQLVSSSQILKNKKYVENFEKNTLYEHGPAWCLSTPLWPTDDRLLVKQMESDIVPCYKLKQWPSITREYFNRESRQWPSREIIEQFSQNTISCLLTPVGYKLSENHEHEWRISFSLIELELVKTLNKNQRLCYVLFKSIYKEYVLNETNRELLQNNDGNRVISSPPFGSYILKNIFFYFCEKYGENWCLPETILDCIEQLFIELKICIINRCCPHYIISSNNLLMGIDDTSFASMINPFINKINRILEHKIDVKNIIASKPMFMLFFECIFEQIQNNDDYEHFDDEHFETNLSRLKDFYLTFDERDTIVMPLINAYDCIFTRLAHVFHPNKGLTFEDLIAILDILAIQYKEQETREIDDEDEINPYINFTNIIERCYGNLYLQNISYINDINDSEIIINTLDKVRFHYTNSYPLFDVNDFSFNDKLSGKAMIAYLRYCNYNYYEAAAFSLSALLENEEKFIENYPRSITALQIPISTKYCDEIILNFLFEQGTDLIECPILFASALPVLLHVYIHSMIKLDFDTDHPELTTVNFSIDVCFLLLEYCQRQELLPLNKYLYEKAKESYHDYTRQKQQNQSCCCCWNFVSRYLCLTTTDQQLSTSTKVQKRI
ncbi:unnamed protein product [Didymodactylos carnosus]|uniref:Mab-21-like HhH/H2TH-like domain-containing protein n=1 Tax=Didymodactylos carnosus TaxID=1234261 RepID=A0A8S2E6Z9_9BILA|nr:unnamed protein product [Didymodactylos carnosus]CAF3907487.1 unnamed protein product [Didymodactylos carnosus]